jgi:hypothetical protein
MEIEKSGATSFSHIELQNKPFILGELVCFRLPLMLSLPDGAGLETEVRSDMNQGAIDSYNVPII